MSTAVLLLNSDKPEIIARLRARDARVSVIAHTRYAALYDPAWPIELVDDLSDVGQVVRAGRRLARRRTFDCAVAATEKSLIPAGHLRRDLGLRGQGVDEAFGFAHKVQMKRRLRAAGVPVTDFDAAVNGEQLEAAARRLGLPVVIKPVLGSGCAGTVRIDTVDQLAGVLGAYEDGVAPVPRCVEAFVDVLQEFHCDAVVRDGDVRFCAVSAYLAPVLTTPRACQGSRPLDDRAPLVAALREMTRRAVRALGLADGVVHFESFETARGLVVGELTCRPGGGIARTLQRAWGVDMWHELLLAELRETSRCAEARPLARTGRAGSVGWTRLPGAPEDLAHLLDDDAVAGVWPTALSRDVSLVDLVADDDAALLAAHARLTHRVPRED